jgi:glycine/D-amino acid oxidase-like deaminating enzyme
LNSYPYWWDTLSGFLSNEDSGAAGAEGELANAIRAKSWDVAVIGAGYTGLSAARQLARSGAAVVVLERERAGWGASSRNGGQVLTGLRLDAAALVQKYGAPRARELFDVSLEAVASLEGLVRDEGIECEYEQTGHIQAAYKPSHFDAFREEQQLLARVFNHEVTLVPPADQASELGSHSYHGLLVDERSGALNPARYVHGLARAAKRSGACIAEHVGVLNLSRDGGRWTVKTTRGDLQATDVFIATNGYTGAATPGLRRRLIPVGSYIIATPPLAPDSLRRLIPRRRMVFDSRNFLYYFRLTGDHRLIFGGRVEFREPAPESAARAATILERGMTRVFPELAGTSIDYAWGGNVAFARDQMPHAGRLDGAYFAAGYSGHGVAMATYLGGLMARRIGGETFDHPLIDGPFPAVPFYNGRPWFLPLVGAYYRFRDWVD